jgi:hypothetical protein
MTFEVLAVIVYLNVMATIALWRQAARRPEKLKKKFLASLRDSNPIVPKHQRPMKIGDEGYSSITFLVTNEHRLFFNDFTDFAAVVNRWLAEDYFGGTLWRLQELPQTELQLGYRERPDFGRRYAIFHNQVKLGTLEVSPSFHYSTEKPVVRSHVELDWVRLIGFDTIREFLDVIALHVSDADPHTAEYIETRVCIDRALTRALWQAQHIMQSDLDGTDHGELELCLEGSAAWYLERREALRRQPVAA